MTVKTQRGSCLTSDPESWSDFRRLAFNASNPSAVAISARAVDAHLPVFNMSVQMEVIKKAYHQESECEGVEVSPREVGHNIYILAQQVQSVLVLSCSKRDIEKMSLL